MCLYHCSKSTGGTHCILKHNLCFKSQLRTGAKIFCWTKDLQVFGDTKLAIIVITRVKHHVSVHNCNYTEALGAVHILRQPKSGVSGPPLRQQLSAFGLPPLPPPTADVICERPLISQGENKSHRKIHFRNLNFAWFNGLLRTLNQKN